MQALIHQTCKLDVRDKDGRTPLHLAAEWVILHDIWSQSKKIGIQVNIIIPASQESGIVPQFNCCFTVIICLL